MTSTNLRCTYALNLSAYVVSKIFYGRSGQNMKTKQRITLELFSCGQHMFDPIRFDNDNAVAFVFHA